ncbi:MAG: hypothetical protein KDA52_01065 [Planctomycetaceae bacterium]|nr:hypothetical protein [Planctomycetaceae bacterium]
MSSLLPCVLGCANGANGPLAVRRVNDPPQLSPYARSLAPLTPETTTHNVGRPPQDENAADQPLTSVKPRSAPQESLSEPSDPNPLKLSAPTPTERLPKSSGASDEPSILRDEPIQLIVTCPKTIERGEDVTFKINVQNVDHTPLEGVVIVCRLPDGLDFPNAAQRVFRQKLGQLDVDHLESIELTLRCKDFGNHCVEFEVAADGLSEGISQSACVECLVPTSVIPPNPLELTGPTERSVGNRAEFVMTLRNLTGIEQPDVHVQLQYEGVLEPREASAGALRQPCQLQWNLGLLRIDERVQIQVEFECQSTSDETCVTAIVKGRNLNIDPVESCLKITPPEAIDLNIVDRQDPVMIGERVAYVIQVRNTSLQPLSNAVVKLQADGLQPVGLTIGDNESPSGAGFDRITGLITIPLPEKFPPEATQMITLQTLATRAGAGIVTATITGDDHSLQISTTEPTVINSLGSSVAYDDP